MHNVLAERYTKKDYTELDHVDRNGLNNQKANLRISSHGENIHNARNYGEHSKGVRLHTRKHKLKTGKIKIYTKYQARISVNGKSISLGYFNEEKDARKAYRKASQKYYPNVNMDFDKKGPH